jgi:glycosyltransferase involved in cell wall biosynthesis
VIHPPAPRVSVCICAFNAARFLDAALASAAQQTYRNLEILVIDDGSSDETAAVATRWSETDSRVRLLHFAENRGIAYARQTALEAATGDWVVFLDADDVALPEMIERQMTMAQNDSSIAVVGVAAILTGPRGPSEPIGVRRVGPSSKDHFRQLVENSKLVFMETPALMSRQVAIEAGGLRLFASERDATVRMRDFAEDLDLWCRISDVGRQGRFMIALPEPLVYIRKTAGSLSSVNSRLMAMKMAWIKDCLRRRRQGRPELQYDDFERSMTRVQWLRFQWKAFAAQQWRELGSAYMERKWVEAAWRLFLLLLVNPRRLIRGRVQRIQQPAKVEDS